MTPLLLESHLVVDPAVWQVLLIILAVIAGLGLMYLIRIHIAYRMAQKRHREPVIWALISFFTSPLFVWIMLYIMGDDTDKQNTKADSAV